MDPLWQGEGPATQCEGRGKEGAYRVGLRAYREKEMAYPEKE